MLARLLRRPLASAGGALRAGGGGRVEDLFEARAEPVQTGRPWEAWELRQKGFADLHKLWYVLLKEKILLYSQKEFARSEGQRMPDQHRIVKVRKSMCRIKQVLTERALTEADAEKQFVYKKMINDM